MSGTKLGGQKAALKNLANEPDFYKRIGTIGGRNGRSGGFATDIDCTCSIIRGAHFKRQCAGKKGGRISRRKKVEA